MTEFLLFQASCLLRLLTASVCGGLIGYERESHFKMAGIRTHTIVSLTSALMMMISKYGFFDVLTQNNISLDPSRIAAGVVTAIGFLGASVIFTRKTHVSGITTSAGLWAVVGIGMSFGAGMYIMGIAAALFILILQFTFRQNSRFTRSPSLEQITIRFQEKEEIDKILETLFTPEKIIISNIRAARLKDGMLEIKLSVHFPEIYSVKNVITLLKNIPEIISIEI